MELDINFKKWAIILAIVIGSIVYIRKNYTYQDLLRYSQEKPHPTFSPMIDYYVGLAYYMRKDLPNTTSAFGILAANYPTSHYTPKALLRMGASYQEMRQFGNARKAYEQYMKDFPEGKDIDIVKKRHEVVRWK